MIEFGNGKELLQLIPKKKFRDLAEKWSINHRVRSFTAWDQVCTFIMAFILRLESLREVEMVLAVPRSTFSDANAHRCSGFFQELCEIVLSEIQAIGGSRKARYTTQRLLGLDSTECDVHGSVGQKYKSWRKKKTKTQASVKLHTLWNIGEEKIEDYRVTAGRTADSPAGNQFPIKPGVTYVFDRAYNDLRFWWKIIDSQAHFVSRGKLYKNYRRDTKKIKTFPKAKTGVLWDGGWRPCKQVVRARGKKRKLPTLRRILYRDPESNKAFEFITSNKRCSAQTVANIYKKRWAVELLFRWMKGHLGIRRLKMKNINAIKVQLTMAVLTQLLVQLYRLKNKTNSTLWQCLRSLRSELTLKGLGNTRAPSTHRRKPLSSKRKTQYLSTG